MGRCCPSIDFSKAALLAEAAPGLVAAIAMEMKESSRFRIGRRFISPKDDDLCRRLENLAGSDRLSKVFSMSFKNLESLVSARIYLLARATALVPRRGRLRLLGWRTMRQVAAMASSEPWQ